MKYYLAYICLSFLAYSYSQKDSRGSIGDTNTTRTEGNTYALIIGISDYNETALKLNYADNDAALFKNYLSTVENVPEENITLLINKKAVSITIGRELRKLATTVSKGDTVYIYFAGHGDVVDDLGLQEGFLLAAEVNANQEYFAGGAISLNDLNNRIIKAIIQKEANVILILDACRSGFIFEDGTQKNMGTLQAMFKNTTKFLSCGAEELSYESSDLQHGYFTHFLVKGLTGKADTNSDKQLQYRELDDYLYNNVSSAVSQKYNQKQTPIVNTKDARAILKNIKPNNEIVSFESVKQSIDQTKAIASRYFNTNKTLPIQISRFANAIKTKNYHGKSSSAYAIYKTAIADNTVSKTYIGRMKGVLLSELSNAAQKVVNTYISNDEKLPNAKTFTAAAKHLEICLELMEDDDLMRDKIEVSKLMLDAYSSIRNNNMARFPAAKQKLKKALNIEPKAAYVHNALGIIYNYQKVYDSAYYHFNTAKKLIKTWSEPVVNLGDNYIDQYKFDEARAVFDASLGIYDNDIANKLRLAEIYINQGKYYLAKKLYQDILKIDTTNPKALEGLSNLETLKGNFKAANDWYTKISSTDDIDLLKYIKANKLDPKTAEQLLLNAISDVPELSKNYSNYADYLRLNNSKLTRLKTADSLYKTAIKKDARNTNAYTGLAWLNHKQKRKTKAKQIFLEGLKSNPNSSELYLNYGAYLEKGLKDKTGAINNYLKAIDKNKSNIAAYYNLVALYNNQKQTNASINLLTQLTQDHSDIPEFWNLLGKTQFMSGNYSDAIRSYKKAIAIDDSYAKVHSNLAYSAVQTNDIATAKKHFSISSSQEKDTKAIDDVSAYIINAAKNKLNFGKPDDARNLYKLAYDIHPTFKTGYAYAKFLYLQEDTSKAIEIGESLADEIETKADKIEIIQLLIKATIDANAIKKCDAYYNGLLALKTKQQDYLLAAVYSKFKGNIPAFESYISKVNPFIIRDNKVKDDYSPSTISKYILRQ